jgi:hypothetical protein
VAVFRRNLDRTYPYGVRVPQNAQSVGRLATNTDRCDGNLHRRLFLLAAAVPTPEPQTGHRARHRRRLDALVGLLDHEHHNNNISDTPRLHRRPGVGLSHAGVGLSHAS